MQGVGAGALGLTLLSCGDNETAAPAASALYEPTSTQILVSIWAKSAKGATAVVELGGALVMAVPIALDADGFGVADLVGLAPATTYAITVTTSAGTRIAHRAVTAPRDDDPRPVRIAVSADLDPIPEFENGLIAEIAAAEPDVFVAIGDFPYTDDGPPAVTVDEYRARHLAMRGAPSVRPLFESAAMFAIYDDHEFRNNWDAMFVAAEPARYAAAMQVWDEYFPLRGTTGEIRYRSWRWGANVEGFMLDCRRFRSADADPDGPDKTMLGATQKAWFLAAIARSTATFKIVFTSIPLDFGVGDDFWASFATERDAILAALVGISGVVFISGDQHWFAAHRHAHGIREFQIGPIARGLGVPPTDTPAGVLFRSPQYNAGIIDVTATTLTMTALAADGSHFYSETLTAAELTPLQ
jgi:phosphodiesterase/alkaline phosphatase D-like protein